MIQAKIIAGGKSEERLSLAKDLIYKVLNLTKDKPWETLKNHPDFFLFSPLISLGIAEVREIEYQIHLKPYSYPLKIVLIENADRLTIQAQNAFLKTLEEPPVFCLIILIVEKKSALLPTVLSRCQVISLPAKVDVELSNEEEKKMTLALDLILNGDVGQKFLWAEVFGKDKNSAEASLAKISLVGQKLLKEKPQPKLVKFLHLVIFFRRYLDANINPRFALENLFLSC
ncbi:hypothetical protein HY030_00955 [Candidatus Gottesmanbacteria bacterium]|nr:hypothetical protein [Candidatus Gottesmanbacteria bacterium]